MDGDPADLSETDGDEQVITEPAWETVGDGSGEPDDIDYGSDGVDAGGGDGGSEPSDAEQDVPPDDIEWVDPEPVSWEGEPVEGGEIPPEGDAGSDGGGEVIGGGGTEDGETFVIYGEGDDGSGLPPEADGEVIGGGAGDDGVYTIYFDESDAGRADGEADTGMDGGDAAFPDGAHEQDPLVYMTMLGGGTDALPGALEAGDQSLFASPADLPGLIAPFQVRILLGEDLAPQHMV